MLPVCQCHWPWDGSNLQNTVRGGERQCVARSRMASVATKLAFGQDGGVTPPLVRVGGLERFCADAAVLGDNQLARLVARTAERSLLRLVEVEIDRKSTRLNSSHTVISYAVFCLKKKKTMPG